MGGEHRREFPRVTHTAEYRTGVSQQGLRGGYLVDDFGVVFQAARVHPGAAGQLLYRVD